MLPKHQGKLRLKYGMSISLTEAAESGSDSGQGQSSGKGKGKGKGKKRKYPNLTDIKETQDSRARIEAKIFKK